jgi:hypothetical protein
MIDTKGDKTTEGALFVGAGNFERRAACASATRLLQPA